MSILGFLVLAFPPAVFWLWFFARRSRYRPIPFPKLAWTFVFGMIAAVPAAVAEVLLLDEGLLSGDVAPRLSDVTVAMCCWWWDQWGGCPVWSLLDRCKEVSVLEEPLDGLVHGVAASLGFSHT